MDQQKKNPLAPPTLETLLTRGDLEQVLQVSSRTIGRLIQSGQLPQPLKVGCRWRWRAGDISKFLGTVPATQE